MGSSLDDKYSVTCVAAKAAWYIPYMIWSRGGASGRIIGGGGNMGGKLGVWKGVLWVFFVNGVLLGYFDGIFLGWVNGCELESSYGVFLGKLE